MSSAVVNGLAGAGGGERAGRRRRWHHRADHHLPSPNSEHPAADREVGEEEETRERRHRHIDHLPIAPADPNGRVGWVVQRPQALSHRHRRIAGNLLLLLPDSEEQG